MREPPLSILAESQSDTLRVSPTDRLRQHVSPAETLRERVACALGTQCALCAYALYAYPPHLGYAYFALILNQLNSISSIPIM